MSIDPSLPSDEPSDEASSHANKNRVLWNIARDLAEPLREVLRELDRNEACPYNVNLYPGEFAEIIDDLMTANLAGGWAEDARAFDKQALTNAQQLTAELREDR